MTPSNQPPVLHPRCPQCGAEQQAAASFCWLCGAWLGAFPAKSVAAVITRPGTTIGSPGGGAFLANPVMADIAIAQAVPPVPSADPWLVHGSIWAALVLVIAVGCGVLGQGNLKLTAFFALTAIPALLFTIGGAALGRLHGRPWDLGKRLLSLVAVFSLTMMLTMLIVALLILSAIVAFIDACFGGGSPG